MRKRSVYSAARCSCRSLIIVGFYGVDWTSVLRIEDEFPDNLIVRVDCCIPSVLGLMGTRYLI